MPCACGRCTCARRTAAWPWREPHRLALARVERARHLGCGPAGDRPRSLGQLCPHRPRSAQQSYGLIGCRIPRGGSRVQQHAHHLRLALEFGRRERRLGARIGARAEQDAAQVAAAGEPRARRPAQAHRAAARTQRRRLEPCRRHPSALLRRLRGQVACDRILPRPAGREASRRAGGEGRRAVRPRVLRHCEHGRRGRGRLSVVTVAAARAASCRVSGTHPAVHKHASAPPLACRGQGERGWPACRPTGIGLWRSRTLAPRRRHSGGR